MIGRSQVCQGCGQVVMRDPSAAIHIKNWHLDCLTRAQRALTTTTTTGWPFPLTHDDARFLKVTRISPE